MSNVMNLDTFPDEHFRKFHKTKITTFVTDIRIYIAFVLSSSTESFPNGSIENILDNGKPPLACKKDVLSKRVAGKILLVQRGGCTFDEKLENAESAGAIGVLFYDSDVNEKSVIVAKTKSSSLPCAGIDLKIAQRIINSFKTNMNSSVQITFPHEQQVIYSETAGRISGFSSAGPTYELDLKPSITGIGGEVFSTLPLHVEQGWGVRSGTSMAAPHVAGTAALVLEYYSKMKANVTPIYVLEHLQNHARIVESEDGKVEHPLVQGAGLVQRKKVKTSFFFFF